MSPFQRIQEPGIHSIYLRKRKSILLCEGDRAFFESLFPVLNCRSNNIEKFVFYSLFCKHTFFQSFFLSLVSLTHKLRVPSRSFRLVII